MSWPGGVETKPGAPLTPMLPCTLSQHFPGKEKSLELP